MSFIHRLAPVAFAFVLAPVFGSASTRSDFTLRQVLDYPFVSELAGAEHADAIAWVRNVNGVRNVWSARGPDFVPVQVTRYTQDDGQEITQLTFSPDGTRLLYVRGGDHDANWPAEGNLEPDPAFSTEQPKTTIWSASLTGGEPQKIAEGDTPSISSRNQLAYTKDDHVWTASLDGTGKPETLFFDRGRNSDLQWSPDGAQLAFVSNRADHAFIGIFTGKDRPIVYLAPSTGRDLSPRWSADGTRIAFLRLPGEGGPPQPILKETPQPWSIWVSEVGTASAHSIWQSPETLPGSYPDVIGEANLHWAAGDRLVFLAYLDEWPHLYSIASNGGATTLLTPGAFMVEHITISRDRRFMIYDANTGQTAGDYDRRHLFRVPVDRATPTELTSGESLEWTPVSASNSRIAFIAATAQLPPEVATAGINGTHRNSLNVGKPAAEFPAAMLTAPKPVLFQAPDGTSVHGQLFERDDVGSNRHGAKPGVIFVHGGPPRQMLLGWHYLGYYSNAYALNQYLAAHGFVVLSVNYRLGIGYGRSFHHPEHAGFAGAVEYQDVLAGAHFLQGRAGVDGGRIGIWGGSYGGYLTAMALAHNSDVFKAGVDFHGVHDWSKFLERWVGKAPDRYEKGDREEAREVAWRSSPESALDGWRSPVLLIQGDDDRNVPFQETVDLARRLQLRKLPYEELVIPNEIHAFLRNASWLRVDEATATFLAHQLGVAVPPAGTSSVN